MTFVAEIKKWNGLRGNTIAYGKSLKIITTENRGSNRKRA
jgi:membrane-bound lytic murein transglycosylase D